MGRFRFVPFLIALALTGTMLVALFDLRSAEAFALRAQGPQWISTSHDASWSLNFTIRSGERIPVAALHFGVEGLDAGGQPIPGALASVTFEMDGDMIRADPTEGGSSLGWTVMFDRDASDNPDHPASTGYGPVVIHDEGVNGTIDGDLPPDEVGYGYGSPTEELHFVFNLTLHTDHPALAWIDSSDRIRSSAEARGPAGTTYVLRSATATLPVGRVPAAPASVAAVAGPALASVQIVWSAPPPTGVPLSGYVVHHVEPGGATIAHPVGPDITEFIDEGLDITTNHRYFVTATNAIGTGPGSTEVCSAASPWYGPLTTPVDQPCPVPSGWTEEVLWGTTGSIDGGVGTPAVNVELVTVHLHPDAEDDDFYEIEVGSGGQQETIRVFTGGLLDVDQEVSLLNVGPQSLPLGSATFEVSIRYRYDAEARLCALAEGGSCLLRLPVDPTDPDWTRREGQNATLVIEAVLVPDGGEPQRAVLAMPLIGQILAATSD